MHRATEVAQHDVAVGDDTLGRVVVRAGRIRPGGDDREVGALVAGVEHALDELTMHVDLPTAAEGPLTHRGRDLVDCVRGRAQRVDLRRVLHDPERPGDVDRTPEPERGISVVQLDHEARPGLVADGGHPRAAQRARPRSRSGRRSPPMVADANAPSAGSTRGASSRGTTSIGGAVGRTTSMVSRSSGIAS